MSACRGVVNIGSGSPQQQQTFNLRQCLVVREPGYQQHPFDFAFVVPDPNAAQVGSVLLMSNSFGAHNPGMRSQLQDLGRMQWDGQSYVFELDPTFNDVVNAPNAVAAPAYVGPDVLDPLCSNPTTRPVCDQLGVDGALDQLAMSPLSVRRGQVVIQAAQGQIAGQMGLLATAIDDPNIQSQYQAQFFGNYVGNANCP